VVSLGGKQYKYILSIVFLLTLICPTVNNILFNDVESAFQPFHIADDMPYANQSLLLKDSNNQTVFRITYEFELIKGWTYGEEWTVLDLGFDALSLGQWITGITFEPMTFRWWGYSAGDKAFDYKSNLTIYSSDSTGRFRYAGSEGYEIEESDLMFPGFICGSMTFINFTIHTLFGSLLYDEEAFTAGVNLTKQADGWFVSTFSNISSTFTANDSVVEYIVNTQLPIPQWLGILPYALGLGFGLGAVALVIVILRIVVIEVRRSGSA